MWSTRKAPTFLNPRSGNTLARRGWRGGSAASAAALLSLLVLASPALADDKAACSEGIVLIKSEIAKSPSETVLSKLKKALRVAEREQGEGEFDECLDAVNDAKRAVK